MKTLNNLKIFNINQDNKTLFKNFIALTLLQATNFILPLVTLPYIIKVIGAENFGILNIAQALATYLVVFTDYGFNLSATRDVSINRDNTEALSEISSVVFATKLILCLIGFIILSLLILAIPKFRAESVLFFFSFSIVIGQALLPIWFFQGIEKMKFITYLNLFSKVLFTVLIFIIINKPSDYVYIVLLNSVANILSGIAGIWIMAYSFNIRFNLPEIKAIKKEIQKGWYIFTSNLSNVIYTNSNILILGFFSTNLVVGYYSIAEKVMTALKQILIVFSQAIYPKVCRLSLKEHLSVVSFIRKVIFPFTGCMFMICSILFFLTDQIVYFFTGDFIPEPIFFLKMLIFVPFIISLNIPPYQTLLAYNLKRSYSSILMLGAIINICLNLLLVSSIQALGTVITVIATETFITLGLYIILEVKYPKYSLFSKFAVRPNSSL